jgi:hypothetical protein
LRPRAAARKHSEGESRKSDALKKEGADCHD